MKQAEEQKSGIGLASRAVEFVAIAAGLAFGILYLNPMTVKSIKEDVAYTLPSPSYGQIMEQEKYGTAVFETYRIEQSVVTEI